MFEIGKQLAFPGDPNAGSSKTFGKRPDREPHGAVGRQERMRVEDQHAKVAQPRRGAGRSSL